MYLPPQHAAKLSLTAFCWSIVISKNCWSIVTSKMQTSMGVVRISIMTCKGPSIFGSFQIAYYSIVLFRPIHVPFILALN
jgi:hypothetical protein